MSRKVSIDEFDRVVEDMLTEYVDSTSTNVKAAVKKVGDAVKEKIKSTAPKDTGRYAKSWDVKKTKETTNSMEVVVHSKTRYRLTHLLEKGHAKRGGGRVRAIVHIAPAEKEGFEMLVSEVEKGVKP